MKEVLVKKSVQPMALVQCNTEMSELNERQFRKFRLP